MRSNDGSMRVTKLRVETASAIPLIAALPYGIMIEPSDALDAGFAYDPTTQTTRMSGRRDFSTCREDESAGGLFQSKSDTKKDD